MICTQVEQRRMMIDRLQEQEKFHRVEMDRIRTMAVYAIHYESIIHIRSEIVKQDNWILTHLECTGCPCSKEQE